MNHEVLNGDCLEILTNVANRGQQKVHLVFLDPPFNQNKGYQYHSDNMPEEDYWKWIKEICQRIFEITVPGGSLYFMQREKNAHKVMQVLEDTGWTFQNLIIWNKLASPVPSKYRFNKNYQIIAFYSKGKWPKTFNNLKYEPNLLAMHEYERNMGTYVTDIWDNIREMTSGFFAGEEAIRIQDETPFTEEGHRFHKQQSPIELLTRIILSSSLPGDVVLDPFAGTGVTSIVAKQLHRNSIAIEIDPSNITVINQRLKLMREADQVQKFYCDYMYSDNLDQIWSNHEKTQKDIENFQPKKLTKAGLSNIQFMQESLLIHLINQFKVPKTKIKLNARFKNLKTAKVHRFELQLMQSKEKIIYFRLIYAKSLRQASKGVQLIKYESKMMNEIEKVDYYVLISGLALKRYMKELRTIPNLKIFPFLGWEEIFQEIPRFSQIS